MNPNLKKREKNGGGRRGDGVELGGSAAESQLTVRNTDRLSKNKWLLIF